MGETYGFNPIVALTAVECPECGYAQVADQDATGHYQCSECLHRFGSATATFHGQDVDPRDNGATVNDLY